MPIMEVFYYSDSKDIDGFCELVNADITKKEDSTTRGFMFKNLKCVTVQDKVPSLPKPAVLKPSAEKLVKKLAEIRNKINGNYSKIKKKRNDLEDHKLKKSYDITSMQCHRNLLMRETAEIKEFFKTARNCQEQSRQKILKFDEMIVKLEKKSKGLSTKSAKDEIFMIQHEFQSGQLTASEKRYLEKRRIFLENVLDVISRLNSLKAEKYKLIQEGKPLGLEKKKKYEQKMSIKREIDRLNDLICTNIYERRKKIHNYKVVIEEIHSLEDANKKLYEQKMLVKEEYCSKLRKYEEYLEIVDYVNRFKKIQEDLKNKEEEAREQAVLNNCVVNEIEACDFLIGFLETQRVAPEVEAVSVVDSDHDCKTENKGEDPKINKIMLSENPKIVCDTSVIDNLKLVGVDRVPVSKDEAVKLIDQVKAKKEELLKIARDPSKKTEEPVKEEKVEEETPKKEDLEGKVQPLKDSSDNEVQALDDL